MADERKTKIIKVPAKTFTIKKLYDIIIEQLQSGDNGWELMRNLPFPYGAVFKVPNYKDGEYGYAAIMYDDIVRGASYWNWLKANIDTEFVHSTAGINLGLDALYLVNNGVVSLYHKETTSKETLLYSGINPTAIDKKIAQLGLNVRKEQSTGSGGVITYKRWLVSEDESIVYSKMSYSFSPTPEIFYRNASVIFFSMFKQYEDTFHWKEMMGNYRGNYKAKPITYYGTNQKNPTLMDPSVYPGTGCPVIGSAPTFFQDNADECDEVIVYLTRTKHNVTIAVNFKDYYEYAQLGFFDAFQGNYEYAFPAMASSSMSGALPLAELFSYNSGEPSVHHNFQFDFTDKNVSMTHAMPVDAAAWWNGSQEFLDNYALSSVQAMLPSGRWQSFFNLGIRQDSFYNKQWGLFYNSHKEPERLTGSRYFILPQIDDLQGVVNLMPTMIEHQYDYDFSTAKLDEYAARQNKETYGLLPMYLVQRTTDNVEQNILGQIPGIYHCSRKVTRYGLYKDEASNKYYLVVPNCKKNRQWTYKSYYCTLLGETQSNDRMLAEKKRIDRLSDSMNMAIELGEIEEEI